MFTLIEARLKENDIARHKSTLTFGEHITLVLIEINLDAHPGRALLWQH